jgi:hypothetical protein
LDPGSVVEYTTERGDVLLSVQLVLIREAERRAAAMELVAGSRAERPVPPSPAESQRPPVGAPAPVTATPLAVPTPNDELESPAPLAAEHAATAAEPNPRRDPAPDPVRPPLAPVPSGPAPVQVAGPPTWTGMADTGAGLPGVSALRRDLVLEQAWPTARAPRPSVLVATVESPVGRRVTPVEADRVTRAMGEIVADHLGPKDRRYRTGPCELSVILRGLDGRPAAEVVAAIAGPLSAMVERRLPGTTLRATIIEPAEAVRHLAAVHWTDHDPVREPLTGGGLASAV